MNVKKSVLFLLVLSLLGCNAIRPPSLLRPEDASVRAGSQRAYASPVTGRVDFAAVRQTQATPGDVVHAATVSLIDTATNQTIATGKTDASGAFTINPAGLAPANGNTYLIEAVKGLNGQAPGSSAARFRTVIQWQEAAPTGWLSCSNDTVGGAIVINALTTALAIEAALDPVNVPIADTIGKVNVLTSPASLNTSPGPYTDHPDSEITQLASDLVSYLSVDTDPIAMVPSILPSVTSFSPQSGPTNTLVRIQGTGFSPAPSGNTVTFSGAPAQVLLATPTSLVVAVPANATTGAIKVATGRGEATTSTFTVLSSQTTSFAITGFTPRTGRSETEVTLTGNFPGNPATDATPSVLFAGNVLAPVTAWDPAAGTIVTTVPLGASNGSITVRSGLQNATSLDTFTIQKGDITPMVTLSSTTAGQEDAIYTLPDAVMNHATANWKNAGGSGYCYITGGQNVPNSAASAQGIVRLIPLNADSTIGNYKTVGTLITPRYQHASIVVGNYLYVIGGYDKTGVATNSIEVATINTVDGTLSAFTAATPMTVARAEIDAVLSGTDTILVPLGIKDQTAAGLLTNCEKITVNTGNGTLTTGAIAMAGTLPAALGTLKGWRGYGCDLLGSYLVLAGGAATFSATALGAAYKYNKLIAWPVAADNTMATAPSAGGDLPWSMCYTNAETVTIGGNSSMWVAGGTNAHPTGGTATSGVGYVKMTAAVPGFTSAGSSAYLTYASANAALMTNGTRLYNIGGYSSGASCIASVQSAQILSYTSLNPWGILGNLIWSRYGQATVRLGNRIYQFGGNLTTTGKAYNYTEHFQIRPDGTITSSKYEYNLVTARTGAACIVVNNRIYVIGGNNNAVPAVTQNTIERATYNPATNLITTGFATLPGSYLNIPRAYPAYAYINGYIYVFGGEYVTGPTTSTKLASIERAYVNADGSLSPWELVTGTILPEARSYCNAVVVEDHLYIIAGATTAAINTKDTLMATFDAGGLGTFTRGPSLVTSIHSPAVARIGSYLYVFGGSTSATAATKQVERAPINPDLTLGTWALYQPGGKDVLPAAVSHFCSPPIIYNNWVLLPSGNDGTGTASVTIAEGSIQ